MRERSAILKAAFVGSFVLMAVWLALPGRRLTVDVLNVGQGDAILAQCGAKQLLIDGGPDATVLSKLGRRMPFFDRHLDVVLLTHPHADHYLGLIPVLARYRVGLLLTAGMDGDAPEYAAFLDAAKRAGLDPVAVRSGDRVVLGSCAVADALWPPPAGATGDDPNEGSVVLRVSSPMPTSRHAAVMLMGDATDAVEKALIEQGSMLAADVLKIGHHGSRFSTSAAFIDSVQPQAAVISVGKNRYGHPSDPALMKLMTRGIHVLRTDRDGDVRIVIGRDKAYVSGRVPWAQAFMGY